MASDEIATSAQPTLQFVVWPPNHELPANLFAFPPL